MTDFLFSFYKKCMKKFSFGYGLSKFYPIKIIMRKIESNYKSDFAIVQGNKMFLDPGDSLDLSIRGVYGELDTQIVKNEIPQKIFESFEEEVQNLKYCFLVPGKIIKSG